MWIQAEVIMPFLGEDKSSRVRAAVLRCLHFLILRGMCFSLVHEKTTATFSSLLKQAECSHQIFSLNLFKFFERYLSTNYVRTDASELHQLISIAENASQSQIFSSSLLELAGVYAASSGAWVTSALIFDKLKTNVQSDVNSFCLKSLTYLSHAEGKLQLLLMPSDGFKLVNWLRSNSHLPELSKDASGDFAHCVALHEAYMNFQSSLGMLGNIKATSEVFCFQTWFLVLKTRLLEIVIDLVECLGLLNQDVCNKKQVEENILNSLQQLPRICNQLITP
ncbi:ARM repeat superfamily protein [Raphanus sativus]|nr:ARM repeat superfamily protein [Raphanus sativus]